MSVREGVQPQEPTRDDNPLSEGGLRAPPELSPLGKVWWWFHFLVLVKLARLRFIGLLLAIGALILWWDTLVAHYEKWTRPFFGEEHAASSDYEYFCPMHPQVVTENPREKCPICFMNLTRRKKGEAQATEALPAGVVTRLQLSPYKVVTANIRTHEVGYEPLQKRIETVGSVEFDERKLHRITARVKGRLDELYANVTGQMIHEGDKLARIYSPDLVSTVDTLLIARQERDKELIREKLRLWGIRDEQIKEMERTKKPITHVTIYSNVTGHIRKKYQVAGESVEESAPLYDVADLSTVWIQAQVYESDLPYVKAGLPVRATTEALPNQTFTGKVAFLDPHLDQTSRTLRVRFNIENPDHETKPEVSLRPGLWATVRIDVPADQLEQQYLSRDGKVLAVPETAVIHTGSQKIVFRQETPTTFDAVQVELGPPTAGPNETSFYPVLRGLAAGERVVTVGSYLLDAETRVSAAAGSIYYGGTGAGKAGQSTVTGVRPTTPEDEEANVKANLAKLSTPDQRLAQEQKLCPIQGGPLGGMGPPVKVLLDGQPVLLCCKGCESKARADPAGTLAKVEKLRKTKGQPGEPPDAEAAKIKAALAELSAEDRRLAEAQKYCAVWPEKRLGSMGKPAKVMVKGQPVFLCCPGCEDDAKENADRTLATVEKLKAKAKREAPRK
jgi:RND family efflux transporter MFP subunit